MSTERINRHYETGRCDRCNSSMMAHHGTKSRWNDFGVVCTTCASLEQLTDGRLNTIDTTGFRHDAVARIETERRLRQ